MSYILVGGEVLLRAIKNIARGQVFDENFLMAAATVGAFAIGEFPEGVAVMLFYQLGEFFKDAAVNRLGFGKKISNNMNKTQQSTQKTTTTQQVKQAVVTANTGTHTEHTGMND